MNLTQERRTALDRERMRAVAPFLVPGLGLLAGFVLVYWLLVLTEPGQRLENLSLLGAQVRSEVDRGQSLGALSPVSTVTFGFALVSVGLVGMLRRRFALGIVGIGVMVSSVVAAEILKDVLPRPALVEGPIWLLRNSFPSGSAAVAVAVLVGALLVSPERIRWIVLLVGAPAAGVIAQATQVAGWHRLSDVVGSALLVVAIGSFGAAILAAAGRVAPTRVGGVHPRLYRALLVGAGAVIAIGALVLVVLLVFPLLGSPEGGRRAFLQTAFPLFAVGLTVAIATLFARVIEPFSFGRLARTSAAPEDAAQPDGEPADDPARSERDG
ncbi:MAG TPA: phosphatase PAP2 family protein [Clostridia bacterium]|nr:phosphatase PAP2 family protein [Clostridia bacterium]